jgi:DNA-binding transcriptional ArsR family regulator
MAGMLDLVAMERDTARAFVRSLADPTRLRVLGALAAGARTFDQLEAELGLDTPSVIRQLAGLAALGVVPSTAPGAPIALDMAQLRRHVRAVTEPARPELGDVEADAWERQVLDNFFHGERLKEIPASPKKRRVVLKWLVGQFERDAAYPEAKVNEVIARHHPDFAALRRYLIDEGLMTRQGGVYRRVA